MLKGMNHFPTRVNSAHFLFLAPMAPALVPDSDNGVFVLVWLAPGASCVMARGEIMKRRIPADKQPTCRGKRRYRTQGDALEAAMLAGVERKRRAYVCPWCGQWHLTTIPEI